MPDVTLSPQQVEALRKVLDAVIDGDYYDRHGEADCPYCGTHDADGANMVLHRPDCPVLIARDLKAQME